MVQSQRNQFDESCFQTIEVLLESLFRREHVTVELILGSLYDIGSQDIIQNQRLSSFVRQGIKPIAYASKPIVRSLGVFWFQKNGAKLISEYLYSQVKKDDNSATRVEITAERILTETNQTESYCSPLEIESLRQALENRTRMMGGVIAAMTVLIILELLF